MSGVHIGQPDIDGDSKFIERASGCQPVLRDYASDRINLRAEYVIVIGGGRLGHCMIPNRWRISWLRHFIPAAKARFKAALIFCTSSQSSGSRYSLTVKYPD